MKKKNVLILFMLLAVSSYARELKFWPMIGINYSKLSNTNSKLDYQVGRSGNYLFFSKANSFFIESGLSLLSKKCESNERKKNLGEYDVMKKNEASPYYLNMSLFVGYCNLPHNLVLDL